MCLQRQPKKLVLKIAAIINAVVLAPPMLSE
jgi:hypothetical protein